MDSQKICRNCIHWRKYRECHRRAPIAPSDGIRGNVFPTTQPRDSCGEFELQLRCSICNTESSYWTENAHLAFFGQVYCSQKCVKQAVENWNWKSEEKTDD